MAAPVSRRHLFGLAGAASLGALLASPSMAASRSYDVEPFSALRASVGIAVIIEVGGPQAISAESSDPAKLDRLLIVVEGGELIVGFQPDTQMSNNDIVVHVSAPRIEAAATSSGARIELSRFAGPAMALTASSSGAIVASGVAADSLTIEASSGSSVEVSGTCGQLVLTGSTSANIKATDLDCEDVEVKLSTGSDASVRATASVAGKASTTSTLTVSGSPPSRAVKTSTRATVTFDP